MNTFTLNPSLTHQAHQLIPYTQFIGLEIGYTSTHQMIFRLPFQASHIGNVILPALHGGLIGGFMESAASLFLHHQAQLVENAKIINFSIDYLRSGKAEDLYAQCILTRQGSRISHIAIEAWQQQRQKPIATARAHFQMPK